VPRRYGTNYNEGDPPFIADDRSIGGIGVWDAAESRYGMHHAWTFARFTHLEAEESEARTVQAGRAQHFPVCGHRTVTVHRDAARRWEETTGDFYNKSALARRDAGTLDTQTHKLLPIREGARETKGVPSQTCTDPLWNTRENSKQGRSIPMNYVRTHTFAKI